MDLENKVEELRELLDTKQYTGLRQELMELNEADIAAIMEEMEDKEMLKIFRILPKDLAADVFSYMEVENQQFIITSLSERDAAHIIDNLMADDATDLLEEMPANVVKKLRKKSITKSAYEIGMGKSLWADLENGIKDPQLSTIWRIAEGLEIKPHILIKKIEDELGEDFSFLENIE